MLSCCKCLWIAEIIDLSDESGNLKNLLEHKGEYATQLLKARHSFILIKVDSELSMFTLLKSHPHSLYIKVNFVRSHPHKKLFLEN